MRKKYKISIVTVCYNAKGEIEETIKSVLPFVTDEVEYIVIDGASNDGTLEILDEYKGRITQVLSEKDNGIYDAMNKGIKMARGNWLLFINCGDKLLDIPKELFSEVFLGYDCIIASVRDNEGAVIVPHVSLFMYIKNTVPHQGLFYNISKLDISFDTKYKIFADHDLNLKLYRNKCSFFRLDNVVAYHSLDGISSDKDRAKKEMVQLRRNHGGVLLMIISLLYFKYLGVKYRLTH